MSYRKTGDSINFHEANICCDLKIAREILKISDLLTESYGDFTVFDFISRLSDIYRESELFEKIIDIYSSHCIYVVCNECKVIQNI